MKGKIFCIIGVALILGAAISFAIPSNKEQKQYDIVVKTDNLIGDKIDNKKYQEYEWKKMNESYIKDRNIETKNLYTFLYPNELNEFFLNEYNKTMISGDGLKLNVDDIENFDADKYIEAIKSNYNELKYNKFSYKKEENINISGYDVGYIYIRAMNTDEILSSTSLPIYEEKFIIYINTTTKPLVFEYTIESKKFSDIFLMEMINGIKIKKGKATYNKSIIEDNKLVGSIKQNKFNSYKNGYILSYSLDNSKYQELEITTNNYNMVSFKSIDDDNLLIDYKMLIVEDNMEILTLTSSTMKQKYSNTELYELDYFNETTFEYNKKIYHQIEISYNDLTSKTKKYYIQVLDVIEDNYAISVSLTSNKEIDKNTVYELLNYTKEKY